MKIATFLYYHSSMSTSQPTKRGGARPNTGRKTEVSGDLKTVALSLDEMTVRLLKVLGGGNVSRGAREAARIGYDAFQRGKFTPGTSSESTASGAPAAA